MGYDQKTGVRFSEGTRDFALFHSIRTGSGCHYASYTTSTEVPSPGSKRPGREGDISLPPNAEVRNSGAITPLPFTSSWCGV
jgi:hypothetical protein